MITVKNILTGNTEGLSKKEKEIVEMELPKMELELNYREVEKSIPLIRKNMEESPLKQLLSTDIFEKSIKVAVRTAQFMMQFEGEAVTYREVYEAVQKNEGSREVLNDLLNEAVKLHEEVEKALGI